MHIAEVESWFRRLPDTRETPPPFSEHPGNGRRNEPAYADDSDE